jgi:hypothetical protein
MTTTILNAVLVVSASAALHERDPHRAPYCQTNADDRGTNTAAIDTPSVQSLSTEPDADATVAPGRCFFCCHGTDPQPADGWRCADDPVSEMTLLRAEATLGIAGGGAYSGTPGCDVRVVEWKNDTMKLEDFLRRGSDLASQPVLLRGAAPLFTRGADLKERGKLLRKYGLEMLSVVRDGSPFSTMYGVSKEDGAESRSLADVTNGMRHGAAADADAPSSSASEEQLEAFSFVRTAMHDLYPHLYAREDRPGAIESISLGNSRSGVAFHHGEADPNGQRPAQPTNTPRAQVD